MQLLVDRAGFAASPQLLLDHTPATKESLVLNDEVKTYRF